MNSRAAEVDRKRNERRADATAFMLDLLDGREEIKDLLDAHEDTRHQFTYEGIQVSRLEPTDELADLLPTPLPQAAEIHAEVSVSRDLLAVDRLMIRPEDGAEITLHRLADFAEITRGDQTYMTSQAVLDQGLGMILPKKYRALQPTTGQLIRYARESAPLFTEQSIYEFEDDQETLYRVTMRAAETAYDSIQELELLKLYRHPSGMRVGTRLQLSESLNRRIHNRIPDHIDQHLAIDAVRGQQPLDLLSIESLLQVTDHTKSIEVSIATQRHMDDILEVIALLK